MNFSILCSDRNIRWDTCRNKNPLKYVLHYSFNNNINNSLDDFHCDKMNYILVVVTELKAALSPPSLFKKVGVFKEVGDNNTLLTLKTQQINLV